jgi:hypothetical protein
MVRVNVDQYLKDGKHYLELAGLSTDTKPTDKPAATGSLFLEVDTGDVYAFDEAGEEWNQIAALGGGD